MFITKFFRKPKIGLALGSGGPKGLAHIGVIKVLEKNNISIDFIAGSSVGALVGGFYAATQDIKGIENISSVTNWHQILTLVDPSLRQGLVGGKKIKEFIENYVDEMHFQELKIPFSVMATDLKNGRAVCINKDEVALAIRASISTPLVFKPVEREGKLLVDGGLSVPVPVDIVRKMGADIVIAVNLDADYFANSDNKNANFGFYKIGNSSINLLRYHLAAWNVKSADIVISPRTGDIHWNKFLGNGEDIVSVGEKAMNEKLHQLRKLMY